MKRRITLIVLGMALMATASSADVLVTLRGHLIETDGPWTVEDETIVYTDLDGEAQTIALADVDLEASKETTALRAGKPYVPPEKTSGTPEAILYVGWRCRPCEEARLLLDRLGVTYVEKFDEQRAVRKELKKKVGREYVLPVVDLDGKFVIGYRPEEIRRLVRQEDGPDESEEASAEDSGGG